MAFSTRDTVRPGSRVYAPQQGEETMPSGLWPVALRWEGHDAYRWAAPLAVAGAVGGVIMALTGLPPLDIHGPLHYLGVMDPLCGMTRATRLLLLGRVREAVRYNPAVPLVPLAGLVVLLRAVWGYTRGRWCSLRAARPGRTALIWAVLAGAWEANQQAHAAMLRTTPVPLHVPPLAAGAVTAVLVAYGMWRPRRTPSAGTRGLTSRSTRAR